MAAPVVPKSKENNNLNKLLAREKSNKLSQKNILCVDNLAWPRPSKPVEDTILSKLSEVLKKLPNVIGSKKTPKTPGSKTEKARIRSQLQLGTSSAFRALERDELECLLVSGEATPAITVEHIISLGRELGCPLLCLDGLSASFAAASESKCLPLTIGFRRLGQDKQSDFAEVISMVKEHAPVQPCKDIERNARCGPDHQQQMKPMGQLDKPGKSCAKQRCLRINKADEERVLAEIKRVFSSALTDVTVLSKDAKKKKKKKSKGKKNVKEPFDKSLYPQFEAGKRSVLNGVERCRLEVVLASQEVEEVLNSSPLLQPLVASSQCPVVILPGLTDTLRTLTGGACHFSFLGIKKLNLLPAESKHDFKDVIELCRKSIENKGYSVLKNSSQETLQTEAANGKKAELKEARSDGDTEHTQKKIEDDEGEEEEEDFSYLYILKKESKDLSELREELKVEQEKSKQDTTFSTDFISLSASSTTLSAESTTSSKYKIDKARTFTKSMPSSSHQAKMAASARAFTDPSNTSSGIDNTNHPDKKEQILLSHETLSESCSANPQTPNEKLKNGNPTVSKPDVPNVSPSGVDLERPINTTSNTSSEAGTNTQHSSVTQADSIENQTMDKNLTTESKSATRPENTELKTGENGGAVVDQSACETGQASTLFSVDRGGSSVHKTTVNTPEHDDHLTQTTSDMGDVGGSPDMFSLDRSGSGTNQSGASTLSLTKTNMSNPQKRKFAGDVGTILGSEKLKPCPGNEGIDYLSLDVSARSKQKANALKRKLDGEEGFISFSYSEANIKTMAADPSKKRKKKKKK